uniref:C-type lectin domain-containing protein n=1 Tax=Caenorhabditis tropicalis TaxID=1561998 RepID=A0A1I7UJR7_9PELO
MTSYTSAVFGLIYLLYPAVSFLPTLPPESKNLCEGFGYNWAAEIRCLREIINKCEEGGEKSRGGRSLQLTNFSNLPGESPAQENGNPYTYPRPYSRTYHRHATNQIRPPSPHQSSVQNCSCNLEIEKLEAKFEKKLYEVKMKAHHDTETEVGKLRSRFDDDLRSYERITAKDIVEIKRTLDYMQAPRIANNDLEYFLIQREESWYTASEKCIGYGAHLASIHSRLDNGLVSRLISTNQTVWIGVNDIQKENTFKNSDGTAVDYFRWAQKQPNNEEHNENCVEVDHNGYWNDKLCIITRPFVCKKKIS